MIPMMLRRFDDDELRRKHRRANEKIEELEELIEFYQLLRNNVETELEQREISRGQDE